MAQMKAPYDPVIALEGMFNGSVTRIAYAIKDPAHYAGFTNAVLTECAKRFHDALDDCEIQILDAKWYLEYQLAENKARREAKAREMGTAAKRKHDEIKEAGESQTQEETPSKRSKTEPAKQEKGPQPKSEPHSQPEKTIPPQPSSNPQIQPAAQKQDPDQSQTQPWPKQTQPPESKDDQIQFSHDEFTPQATPAGINDDYNFESMFGDPTGDPDSHKEDHDLNFGLGLDGTFDDPTATGTGAGGDQDPSSLDSLLPGLETYASQPGDSNNNSNNPTNNASGVDGVGAAGDLNNGFSNEFDLPEMGGANDFDDFLNDDGLGGGNYGDATDLGGDQSYLDMTLDDSFFT